MADFKIPNLCGASANINAIQSKFETMLNSAIDGLEADASALKTTLDTDVTALVSDIKKMIPDLPALPEINLQSQLTSLSGMIPGGPQHKALLAEITTKFGSGLTASGLSLDTLVSDARAAITGGSDLCSVVPNFTVPAAGGVATEIAAGIKQAEVDSEGEEPSIVVPNVSLTEAKAAIETAAKKFQAEVSEAPDLVPFTITGTEPPTADIGALTVASAFKDVTFPGGIKLPLTLNKDDPKNVSEKGFARCSYTLSEEFKSTGTLTLKRKPYRIESVQGYSTEYKDVNSIQRGKPERWVAGKKPVYIEAFKQVDQGDFSEFIDLWSVDGNTITIHSTEYKWDGHPDTGVIFRISYSYFDTFEPDRVVLDA
jgi:hypothetical protein